MWFVKGRVLLPSSISSIKRIAHELVKVGSEESVSLYVIRYSGNEAYKDQMLQGVSDEMESEIGEE